MNVTILPANPPSQPRQQSYVPGELIVGLKGPLANVQAQLRAVGARVIQTMSALQIVVVAVPVGKEQEILAKLMATKAFQYVERNGIVSAVND